MCWRGCRRLPSVPLRQRGPCASVVLVSGVGGAWSPGPGPVWCQSGRCALGRCWGVSQVRSPWRAPVAGTSDGTQWWAGGHRTSEGRRPLSFLCPLSGCLRGAPAVVVRPPRPVGLAASQPGWGAPWRIGPVGRVAHAHVRGWCCHARRAVGGFEEFVSPPPVQVAGLLRVPLAALLRRSFPPAADWPVNPGVRHWTTWMHRLLPGGGPCGALPVALARLAWEWWGCGPARCKASGTGARDWRQTMPVGPGARWGPHGLCLHPRGRRLTVLRGVACGCGAGIGQGFSLPGAGLASRLSSARHEGCLGPTAA